VVASYEHGNETSVSIKGWEFLEQLSGYQLVKYSVPWSYAIEMIYRTKGI
jgi:hypothetical protein